MVSIQSLQNTAETGDIILVKDSRFVSQVIQKATNSEVSHIQMFFKDYYGQLFILDANGIYGVVYIPFQSWIEAVQTEFQYYKSKKKLHYERNQQFECKTVEFLKAVLGAKYKISLKKLTTRTSYNLPISERKNQGFFCSELIATFYKQINLLPPHISACQYLPKSFTDKNELQMIPEAKLGLQRLVVL